MLRQLVINPLWIAPPAWFAVDPNAADESAQPAEDFIYHRPVLQREVFELLTPKAGGAQMHFPVQTRLTIVVRVYVDL